MWTAASSASCSPHCPRVNVPPGYPRQESSLHSKAKLHDTQNIALIFLIKTVMGLDMISSFWRPCCHGHMLIILHVVSACTNNPLYVQNLTFVLASQATHCLLTLSLCLRLSRASGKAGLPIFLAAEAKGISHNDPVVNMNASTYPFVTAQ